MEWYWVVTIIVAFFALVGVLIWLGKTGKLGTTDMRLISTITSSLSRIFDTLAATTESKAIDAFCIAMTLLDKAVLAAENDYYNDKITADERYENCMKEFDALLVAAGITLTQTQRNVVDTLIKAACEAMGHKPVMIEEHVLTEG